MRLLPRMRGTRIQTFLIVLLTILGQCCYVFSFGIVPYPVPKRLTSVCSSKNVRIRSTGPGSICCNHQDRAPIVEALVRVADCVKAPFFFPGHQMGRGFPQIFVDKLLNGQRNILRYDLPEDVEDLDTLMDPTGPILEAQELAADLFGSKRTFFLCNGSTVGVMAAIIAAVQVHARHRSAGSHGRSPVVILPRNAHKSAIQGLLLAGASPAFLPPTLDAEFGIHHPPPTSHLRAALQQLKGRVAAVLLVSPTYYGAVADIAAAATAARDANVPLIVDEAHGSHLGLVGEGLGAIGEGADIVIHSTHKTLTALSQASMLHLGSPRTPRSLYLSLADALPPSLDLLQSSSPLLASLDASRWQFGSPTSDGPASLSRALSLSLRLRSAISRHLPLFSVLKAPEEDEKEARGFKAVDPLRLTVCVGALCTSEQACEEIEASHGVYCETASARALAFAIGPATDASLAALLLLSLRALHRRHSTLGSRSTDDAGLGSRGDARDHEGNEKGRESVGQFVARVGLSPRDVFFSPTEKVAVSGAVGRVCAETVVTYPPGIPTLHPGEIVTEEAVLGLPSSLTHLSVLRRGDKAWAAEELVDEEWPGTGFWNSK